MNPADETTIAIVSPTTLSRRSRKGWAWPLPAPTSSEHPIRFFSKREVFFNLPDFLAQSATYLIADGSSAKT